MVNFDLPKFPEDYVHRIGRTGRAGRHGVAISLVNHNDNINVRKIERFTKQSIPVNVIEGFEPKLSFKAAPSKRKPANWKPGSKRNSSPKFSQRGFGKPDAARKDGAGGRNRGQGRSGEGRRAAESHR